MKRSKKNTNKKDAGPGVFANSPFRSLKGLRQSVPPTAAEPTSAVQVPDALDDDELFLRAVGSARPVVADGEADVLPAVKPAPDHTERNDHAEEELFLQAMGSLGAVGGEADDLDEAGDSAPRSSSGRMRQLRRGTLRISEELDLHGFLKQEALRRLGHFITSAYARRLDAVLVITGKGTNSSEGPVLPGAVAAWLREQGAGMVAEFGPAPRDRGGSGAYVVFLRRQQGSGGR